VSGKLQTVPAENIDGLVIGYLKIPFGILFTIIANRVQIVPPILRECQCNRNLGILIVPFFFKQWGGFNKKRAGRLLNGRIYSEMPELIKSNIAACS
jgi:hypothetical protein